MKRIHKCIKSIANKTMVKTMNHTICFLFKDKIVNIFIFEFMQKTILINKYATFQTKEGKHGYIPANIEVPIIHIKVIVWIYVSTSFINCIFLIITFLLLYYFCPTIHLKIEFVLNHYK